MSFLNLGCGKDIKKGWINLDSVRLDGVDVVHDLESYPYPFEDNSIDLIFCSHVVEHLSDTVKFMEECHRILRPEGRLEIIVPYFASPGAFADPTHKKFFTLNTMKYFTSESGLNYYSRARYVLVTNELVFAKNVIFKPLSWAFNVLGMFYERFLSRVFPCSEIRYVLKKPS